MSGRLGVSRLLVAALAVGLGLPAKAGWHSDFDAARAEAVRLDRPLLVHFYAEWCGPCKQMDREVLYAPDFQAQIGRRVVAVKLDSDRDQGKELARRYQVDSLPTDLFLTPDGRVLGRMNGKRAKADYLRRVAAIDNQYVRLRELYLARSDGKVPVRGATDAGPKFPTLGPPQADPAPDSDRSGPPGPRVKPRADGTVLLGLKGHSPVALYHDRKWVKGDARFAWEHQGLTYLMASADELAKFQQDAEKYAPRLLGCDPVLYFDEGRAVPGSTRFAAFFADGLYLFTSVESRAKFRDDAERYTRRRTVLLIDELESAVR